MNDKVDYNSIENAEAIKTNKFEVAVVEILWAYGFHVLSSKDALQCINMLCMHMNAAETQSAIGGTNES